MNADHHCRPQLALVTGARGFIGRNLCNRLLEAGFQVIDFDLPGVPRPSEWQGNHQITPFDGSISDPQDISRAMAGVDKVFHLAAMVGDWIPWEKHQQVTLDGSSSVFHSAVEEGAHVILASSITVYGHRLKEGFCDETTPMGQPMGHYSRAKQMQEQMAQEFQDKGMKLTIIRPANVYGIGSGPWLHTLCETITRERPVLIGDGQQRANLVHVHNLAELMLTAAKSTMAEGEIFNGIDDTSFTWHSYLYQLACAMGKQRPRSLGKLPATLVSFSSEQLWKWLPLKGRPPLTREAFNLLTSKAIIPNTKAKMVLDFQPLVSETRSMAEIRAHLSSRAI